MYSSYHNRQASVHPSTQLPTRIKLRSLDCLLGTGGWWKKDAAVVSMLHVVHRHGPDSYSLATSLRAPNEYQLRSLLLPLPQYDKQVQQMLETLMWEFHI